MFSFSHEHSVQRIRHDHYVHVDSGDQARFVAQVVAALNPLLKAMESRLMSKFSDDINAALDTADTAFDDMLTRTIGDVKSLRATIADLQAQVDAGGLSAAETTAAMARIVKLTAKAAAMDPMVPDTLPPDEGPPQINPLKR